MIPQSQSLYCQQVRRKDEAVVVVVTGSALQPAFQLLSKVTGSALQPASQLLSKVSPGCFLVAVGVPYLVLGVLLVEK